MSIWDALTGNKEEIIPLNDVQAKRLVESAANKLDKVALILVLNSGLQLKEMLSIRASDIDFKACEITIYAKKVRNIKLAKSVIDEIKEYLGTNFDDRLLFPVKEDALWKRLKSYQTAGLAYDYRILRRTYASLAIKRRIDPQVIADNIGIPLPELLASYNSYNNTDKRVDMRIV